MEIQIQPLQDHHDIEAFACGSEALDLWLQRTAKQHLRKGISRTYVAIPDELPSQVWGFYSLTVGEAESPALPVSVAKGLPRKLPIVLLGRLGVSQGRQGQGIGSLLLVDAMQRTLRVSAEVGIAALLVDAKDRQAAAFYAHFGFQALPETPHRLVLPLGSITRQLAD